MDEISTSATPCTERNTWINKYKKVFWRKYNSKKSSTDSSKCRVNEKTNLEQFELSSMRVSIQPRVQRKSHEQKSPFEQEI